jgi:hypothetical protein
MVLPLLGLGMMGVGTGMQMLGNRQRDKATRRALKDYQNAVNARNDQERAALAEESGVLSGFARERQQGVGDYITGLGNAEFPGTDEGFEQRRTGVLNDVGKLTGGQQSAYAYQGSPRYNAEDQQAGITKVDNKRMAEAMLADYTNRQIDERQKNAGFKMSLGDLLRGDKAKTTKERMTLAKALRDLDWQRKTAAMQGELDNAQKKGQWLSMLGGLGTQAGGMVATAGLAGGMEGAAGGSATSLPGGQSPLGNAGFANAQFDPDLTNPMDVRGFNAPMY